MSSFVTHTRYTSSCLSAGRLSDAITAWSVESTTFATVLPLWLTTWSTQLGSKTFPRHPPIVPVWHENVSAGWDGHETLTSQVVDSRYSGTFSGNRSHPSCRVTRFPANDAILCAAKSSPRCQHKELHTKGNTSRPDASALAPKHGDQCWKQRLLEGKVPGLDCLKILCHFVFACNSQRMKSMLFLQDLQGNTTV